MIRLDSLQAGNMLIMGVPPKRYTYLNIPISYSFMQLALAGAPTSEISIRASVNECQ